MLGRLHVDEENLPDDVPVDVEPALVEAVTTLANVAIERISCEKRHKHLSDMRAKNEAFLKSERVEAVQDSVSATSQVLAIERPRLEEVRSLSNPSIVVQRALGLLYAMLYPGEQLESVDHVGWKKLAAMLKHEDLMPRIAGFREVTFPQLMTVPAIRRLIHSGMLKPEHLKEKGQAKNVLSPSKKVRTAASAATAKMLRKKVEVDAQEIWGSIVFPSRDAQGEVQGDVHAAFWDEQAASDFNPETVALSSRTVGHLLHWARTELRVLASQLPPCAAEQKKVQAEELEAAESSQRAALKEQRALQRVLDAQSLMCAMSCRARPCTPASAAPVVRFTRGSAVLSSLGLRPLGVVTEALQHDVRLRLTVSGFARADEDSSLALKRAQVVVKHLCKQGVQENRICAVACQDTTDNTSGDASGSVDGPSSGNEAQVTFARMEQIGPGPILFQACSDNLSEEFQEKLESTAATLEALPGLRVRIEGHTDDLPMWMGNYALAQSRARRVCNFLVGMGSRPSQLEMVPLSEKVPLASNDTAEGRTANRRVEIRVLAPETEAQFKYLARTEDLSVVMHQLAPVVAGCHSALGSSLRRAAAEVLVSLGAGPWTTQLATNSV
jgi:outer membrane protein OmpA-like peptidoglycan-associated protein